MTASTSAPNWIAICIVLYFVCLAILLPRDTRPPDNVDHDFEDLL